MLEIKISFNAPIILGFVGISLIVWGLNYITRGASNKVLFQTYRSSLMSPLTYIRFLTHVLGHSNWEHYIGNMTYFLLLGPMLEEKYGSNGILQVIIITALATAVINYIFYKNIALCGASGICFAFIFLSSFTSFQEGEIPLTFIWVAVIYLGKELYEAIAKKKNVSNMAHIVGGVVGGVIGFLLN